MLTGFHLRVAALLGPIALEEGFALGGGYAVQAHGFLERPSLDLDFYVDKFDSDPFERFQARAITLLNQQGLEVSVERELDVFRQLVTVGLTGCVTVGLMFTSGQAVAIIWLTVSRSLELRLPVLVVR